MEVAPSIGRPISKVVSINTGTIGFMVASGRTQSISEFAFSRIALLPLSVVLVLVVVLVLEWHS